uniref:Uncharacterized protein n=1 Tax=Cannabis sativa TaxID=3483 RepID=A0A803PB61_CANSA
MKLSTKPISSPGRTEKFPPPLMRFLRTNVGSKSRGRSRASPMFVRKKNPSSAIETQEPSSPKVTCMGQVRVRRSSKQKKPTKPRRTGSAPAKVEDSRNSDPSCVVQFGASGVRFFKLVFEERLSAPYRSSSLASRFWGSPLKSEKTEQEPEEVDDDDEDQDREEDCSNEEKPISKLESFESRQTEIEEKFELSQEVDEVRTTPHTNKV